MVQDLGLPPRLEPRGCVRVRARRAVLGTRHDARRRRGTLMTARVPSTVPRAVVGAPHDACGSRGRARMGGGSVVIRRRRGRRGLRRSSPIRRRRGHPMIRAPRVTRRGRGEPRARGARVIHGPCARARVVTSPRGRLLATVNVNVVTSPRGSIRIMLRRDRRDVTTTDGMATGTATGTRRPSALRP
jgi:hypothetical protein